MGASFIERAVSATPHPARDPAGDPGRPDRRGLRQRGRGSSALEVTTPVDVTLAGYSGKYVELQVPADIAACDQYRPWEPWYYAQTPGERWHLWILDVDGVRVVVQSMDHAETLGQHFGPSSRRSWTRSRSSPDATPGRAVPPARPA